jgi:hypothetical protein
LVEHFDGTFHLESFFPAVVLRVVPPRRKLRATHEVRHVTEEYATESDTLIVAEGIA